MAVENFTFSELPELVEYIRNSQKKNHLIYAYNGTGKTRLSMDFRYAGKAYDEEGNVTTRDTLYFNAFTEDLFSWDNDLEHDRERKIKINQDSKFFEGLIELEMENRIKPLLNRYVDFNFKINYEKWTIHFEREVRNEQGSELFENIKVSRGEENMFIWCFFLAVAQLAIDKQERYDWVEYIYIDDPISSLDDHNAISVANHLAVMLKAQDNDVKCIISTHHSLFFNVLCNEFKNANKFMLKKNDNGYILKKTTDTPFIYHVSLIQSIQKAIDNEELYTYHFNILRTILEKAANFHGFGNFSDCIQLDVEEDRTDEHSLHSRMVNIMSHGGYSLFEPVEMIGENKEYFKQIFNNYKRNYKFNRELFVEEVTVPLV
ncbi:AAA family ATPase [Myroides odoratimimus]|uniref:AAA family ATPase n=1 Tax=Myroides odoratimimus TaxID=76832 RepID=UPI002DBF868F|nr:AAA family ATPase [Myroides odoratimimus]MEC4036817.1 AAA family ATPase [Myroides odoratimimus]